MVTLLHTAILNDLPCNGPVPVAYHPRYILHYNALWLVVVNELDEGLVKTVSFVVNESWIRAATFSLSVFYKRCNLYPSHDTETLTGGAAYDYIDVTLSQLCFVTKFFHRPVCVYIKAHCIVFEFEIFSISFHSVFEIVQSRKQLHPGHLEPQAHSAGGAKQIDKR